MNVEKKVVYKLNKCYSMAKLNYKGQDCFLAAAEKQDPCYLFSAEGELLDTVWEGPGGVMTMEQIPGSDGAFLATHEFYSPNDSAKARIVIASPNESGWEVRTLCNAPFVHRFGILNRNGVNYLIICCLKSGHEYKNDWRFLGATYGAVLPEDLSGFDAEHQLELTLLMDGMLKNHGYSKFVEKSMDTAVVACDTGVYQFVPPASPEANWEIKMLTSDPSSDAILVDFDGDGELELGSITPFHGDTLRVYKKNAEGKYEVQWEHPEKCPFLHATWVAELFGKPTWFVGSRQGERLSMVITWDGSYKVEVFDQGAGAANALMLDDRRLAMTNRETDEIAIYTFSEE